jgi:hypothetical protein
MSNVTKRLALQRETVKSLRVSSAVRTGAFVGKLASAPVSRLCTVFNCADGPSDDGICATSTGGPHQEPPQ